MPQIATILEQDKALPRKQRHTAKRIWERLTNEHGFTGKYTIVKDAVRELKLKGQEVFMPLAHPPGEAQVDFGQALVKMDGALRKVSFLARRGRIRTPASSWHLPVNARRRFSKVTCRRSSFSGRCRSGLLTTITKSA